MRLPCAALIALAACNSSPSSKPEAPTGVVLVDAPADGDVADEVRAVAATAAEQHRHLIVYVGATWCEPCNAFHAAAARGDLDQALPGLTLLMFDLDRDENRLAEAGYSSEYVPLFVVPGPDGRATERSTSGAETGGDYVAQLAPRVHALLEP